MLRRPQKVIALDTNILIDYRLKRNPGYTQAYKIISKSVLGKSHIYIPLPVILEVEWVLRSYYKQEKRLIIPFFEELLLIDNVITENKEDIKYAINLYKTTSGISFTDSIIVTQIKSKGYEFLTYDKDLKKIYKSII